MWQNSLIARLCNAALTVKIAQRDNIAQHKTYPSQADQPSAGQAGQPHEQTQPPARQSAQQQPQTPVGPVVQQPPVAQVYGPQQPRYLDMSASPPSRLPPNAYARVYDAESLPAHPPQRVNVTEKRPSTDSPESVIGPKMPPSPLRQPLQAGPQPKAISDVEQQVSDTQTVPRRSQEDWDRYFRALAHEPSTVSPERPISSFIDTRFDDRRDELQSLRREPTRPGRLGKVYTVGEARAAIERYDWRQEGQFAYPYLNNLPVENEEVLELIRAHDFFDTLRHSPGPINTDELPSLTFEQLLSYMNNLPFDSRLTKTIDAAFVKTLNSDPDTLIREYGAGGLLEAFFNAQSYTWRIYNGRVYPFREVNDRLQLVTDSRAHSMIRVVNSLPSDAARGLLLAPDRARDKYKVLAPYLTAAAAQQINSAMAVGGLAGNQSLKHLSQVDYSYVRPNKLLFAQQCFMDMADGEAKYYSLEDIELIEKYNKGWWSRFNRTVCDVKWAIDPFMGLYVPVSGHFNIADENRKAIKIAVDDVVDVNKADAVHRENVLPFVSILNRLPGNVREFMTANPNDPDYVPVNIDNLRKKFLYTAKNKEAKYRSLVPDAPKHSHYYLRMSQEDQAQAINEVANNFVSFCRLMPTDLAVKWYTDVAVASNFYFSYKDGEWTASYPLSGVPNVEEEKAMNEMDNMRDDAKIRIERAPWPVQRAMVMMAPAVRIAEFHKSLARYASEQQRAAAEAAVHAVNLALIGAALIKSLSTGGLSLSLVSPAAREAVKAGVRPAAKYAVGWLWRTFGLPALIYGYTTDPDTVMAAIHFVTDEDVKAPIGAGTTRLLAEPVEHRYHDINKALKYMPH